MVGVFQSQHDIESKDNNQQKKIHDHKKEAIIMIRCNVKNCYYNKTGQCWYENWAKSLGESIKQIIIDEDGKCAMRLTSTKLFDKKEGE